MPPQVELNPIPVVPTPGELPQIPSFKESLALAQDIPSKLNDGAKHMYHSEYQQYMA